MSELMLTVQVDTSTNDMDSGQVLVVGSLCYARWLQSDKYCLNFALSHRHHLRLETWLWAYTINM